jgi:cation transport protein ChaC
MWDDWETQFGCTQKITAILSGHRRVFNKASVRNWGTPEHPAPTLNLEESNNEHCTGFAFAFPNHQRQAVTQSLKDREGRGFHFPELDILLPDGRVVGAVTPIYRGSNLIRDLSPGEIADMAKLARGESGACRDYVITLAERLTELGINDRAVTTLREALR